MSATKTLWLIWFVLTLMLTRQPFSTGACSSVTVTKWSLTGDKGWWSFRRLGWISVAVEPISIKACTELPSILTGRWHRPDGGPLHRGPGYAAHRPSVGISSLCCIYRSSRSGTGVWDRCPAPEVSGFSQAPSTPTWKVRRWTQKLLKFSDPVPALVQLAAQLLPTFHHPAHRES